MHQKRGIAFAWMHSWRQNHSASEGYLLGTAEKICDDYHFTIVAGEGLREHSFSNFVLCVVCAESLQKLTTVRVCVRVAMGHVDLVVIVFESRLEWKCVIWTASFALHRVLVVANILTRTVPSNATGLGCVFHWVEQGLLTLVIRAVWLNQINYVEFVAHVFTHIADFEVVPLGVGGRAIVVLKNQIVRVLTYEESSS